MKKRSDNSAVIARELVRKRQHAAADKSLKQLRDARRAINGRDIIKAMKEL